MPRCCPTVPGDSLGDSSYTVGLKSPEGGQGAPSPRPALGASAWPACLLHVARSQP